MRYTYFASVAKEGYEQISAIFTETADQEKEHAKRMFKFLEGGMVEITASYPAALSVLHWRICRLPLQASTKSGLWTILTLPMLPSNEGFPAIAAMYRNIAIAEKRTRRTLPRFRTEH